MAALTLAPHAKLSLSQALSAQAGSAAAGFYCSAPLRCQAADHLLCYRKRSNGDFIPLRRSTRRWLGNSKWSMKFACQLRATNGRVRLRDLGVLGSCLREP